MASVLSEVSLDNPITVVAIATLAILFLAPAAAITLPGLLPKNTSNKFRFFYIWHLGDALVHFVLEGSFLYNCFFTYAPLNASADYPHPASLLANTAHFLGYADRTYGANYGSNVFAKLWQQYALADRRWGGADLVIISLELLTVFIGGPLALYVSELIRRGAGSSDDGDGKLTGKLWFWGTVLATGELYGGFMTFAPEWLSGNSNLSSENFIKFWIFLVLFNTLWVFIPGWFLYEAYNNLIGAFGTTAKKSQSKKKA